MNTAKRSARTACIYAVAVVLAPLAIPSGGAPAIASTSACDLGLVAPRGSLVGDYWRSRGGQNSVYGCPVNTETGFADRRGSRQQFQNGQIAWSPNMGEGNLLRIYAKNGKINLRWGTTSRDWDFFHVRWVIEADPKRQAQRRVKRETAWSGSYGFNPYPGVSHGGHLKEVFTFWFQGCDRGTFSSDCGAWSNVPVYIVWTS
ncbi:LGFP repeat-containing protein [Nonomuraea dietziae]